MSSNDENGKVIYVTLNYEEIMETPLSKCGGPTRHYAPSKPQEVFETYRNLINEHIRKKWPNISANFTLDPFHGYFNCNGYGGRYTFKCDVPGVGLVVVVIIEPFEASDGELANDMAERKRRAQIDVS
ncbi:unnamed protein product [Rotaria sordida]|uniref:Uncharacterized protein n=1 Tax=Rotaria sordida TaxID=392033 RepID=A0A814QE58_9BILA|nr:unnamed protein product [Rotaria sordida]CAF1136306.1 unnamed protein product [Rotaria sordida]CAF1141490.1 unnamed protein product [Rotaria sordida]CAF1317014.1 unnamed protein product [Rotaria sordida]CAF1392094.1 unnamed protein product [Rotaria sordida]